MSMTHAMHSFWNRIRAKQASRQAVAWLLISISKVLVSGRLETPGNLPLTELPNITMSFLAKNFACHYPDFHKITNFSSYGDFSSQPVDNKNYHPPSHSLTTLPDWHVLSTVFSSARAQERTSHAVAYNTSRSLVLPPLSYRMPQYDTRLRPAAQQRRTGTSLLLVYRPKMEFCAQLSYFYMERYSAI